jgi:hypothetical protein
VQSNSTVGTCRQANGRSVRNPALDAGGFKAAVHRREKTFSYSHYNRAQ